MSEGCSKCKCYDCRREHGRLTEVELKAEAKALEDARSWAWTPAQTQSQQEIRDINHLAKGTYATKIRTPDFSLLRAAYDIDFSGGEFKAEGWTRK